MDNAAFMGLGEAIGNLHSDGDDLADRRSAEGKELTQGLSFDEFEDQEIYAAVMADVVQGADIGMRELGDSTSFVLEAMAKMGILGKMFRQNFDRDEAVEAAVSSAVNFAHAAGAEWRKNFVRAEFCAWSDGHMLRDYNLGNEGWGNGYTVRTASSR